MTEASKNLERAFIDVLGQKQDKPQIFPGLMGAYIGGRPTTIVDGRPDFVWVRIRGATSEPVQAFNEKVSPTFNLPVLIQRDPNVENRWVVIGRDPGAYEDYGGVAYLPSHGKDHSFAGGALTGNDITWVYKRQFMPLLPRPLSTGVLSIHISDGFYFSQGIYHWWVGSGTKTLEEFIPTGGVNAKFVTVSIDSAQEVLVYEGGVEFPAANYPNPLASYIALPSQDEVIPIAAVYLTTGSQWIGWNEIYDLRLAPTVPPGTGTFVNVLDDGILLGGANTFDFGNHIDVSFSGGNARIDATVPVLNRGTPTPLDTISGTYWKVPDDSYASGSLNVAVNGIVQSESIDFTEQHPGSGTYQYTEAPNTGSVHYAFYGVWK